MLQTTRWIDQNAKDLKEVEDKLLSEHLDQKNENTASFVNWKIKKHFDENKKQKFNGKELEYNYYSFSVDAIPAGMIQDDDSITKKSGFIIVYSVNKKIKYIISRNSDALLLLRKMLNYSGKNEIIKNNFSFSEDMFVWLISKVYNAENTFESGSIDLDNLSIDTIKGFKGNTEDLLTKISAKGESVMNIISTLSFLIESQNLNQITMDIAYKTHSNIEITLNNKNILALKEETYLGQRMIDNNNREEILSTIILVLYTEIIPILIQAYQDDIESDQWNRDKFVDFLQNVADDLSEKVVNRIEHLKSMPVQLQFCSK